MPIEIGHRSDPWKDPLIFIANSKASTMAYLLMKISTIFSSSYLLVLAQIFPSKNTLKLDFTQKSHPNLATLTDHHEDNLKWKNKTYLSSQTNQMILKWEEILEKIKYKISYQNSKDKYKLKNRIFKMIITNRKNRTFLLILKGQLNLILIMLKFHKLSRSTWFC